MNPAASYYHYLQRKAFEAGRFGSLNEMRGQVLLLLGTAIAIAALGAWLFPAGSTLCNVAFALAGIAWFGGIAIVGCAFFGVGVNRKKLERKPEQNNG